MLARLAIVVEFANTAVQIGFEDEDLEKTDSLLLYSK